MFGMDRMLAIFYVIAEMQTNINADVLSQVSTLVSLGLLAQVRLLLLHITTSTCSYDYSSEATLNIDEANLEGDLNY